MTSSAEFNQTIKVGSGKLARRVQQPNEQRPWTLDFTDVLPSGYTSISVLSVTLPTGITSYQAQVASGTGVTVYLNTSAAVSGTDYKISAMIQVFQSLTQIAQIQAEFVLAVRDI